MHQVKCFILLLVTTFAKTTVGNEVQLALPGVTVQLMQYVRENFQGKRDIYRRNFSIGMYIVTFNI